MAKELAFGSSGDQTKLDLPPQIAARFNADIPTLFEAMSDLKDELDKTRVFVQA
jgi:hypothetical protein